LAVALVTAALLPAHAAAQATGTTTLQIVDLPPGPATVNAGQTHTPQFNVNFQASGFQCTSAAQVSVTLVVTNANAAPQGVTPSVDPANLTFDIPVGAYQTIAPGLPVMPYNATQGASLRVVASPTAASGTYRASVSAVFPATDLTPNCIGTLPAAEASGTHEVNIVGSTGGNATPPGTSPPPGGNNNTGNGTQPPPPPARSPGFGVEIVVAGAIAAAAAVAGRARKP
jgi:hypothetical protein